MIAAIAAGKISENNPQTRLAIALPLVSTPPGGIMVGAVVGVTNAAGDADMDCPQETQN